MTTLAAYLSFVRPFLRPSLRPVSRPALREETPVVVALLLVMSLALLL